MPSSTASATRCASLASPTITGRASLRSWKSARRNSPENNSSGRRLRLADVPLERVEIDIRAADQDADLPARQPVAERPDQSGGRGGGGRLDGELHLAEQQGHCGADLVVVDQDDVV